jgi:hypothetical protein
MRYWMSFLVFFVIEHLVQAYPLTPSDLDVFRQRMLDLCLLVVQLLFLDYPVITRRFGTHISTIVVSYVTMCLLRCVMFSSEIDTLI